MIKASHAEASNKAEDIAIRLLQARSYIHSTSSLKYESTKEPSEQQLAFCCLQAKVAKKEEALRVTTA